MKNLTTLYKSFLAATVLILSASVFAADPAEGYWYTIDDEDGKKSSIVKIEQKDGKLVGKIVKIMDEKDRNELCQDCPDEFANKPIQGLQFMWNLNKKGAGKWRDGKILDPKTGGVYTSKLDVEDGGEKLTVRGYLGVSWLGRSQTWEKVVPQPESDPK